MRKHSRSRRVTHLQPLEPRRLMSLTPAGVEVPVPTAGAVIASDLAVADDGSFIIASRATGGGNETIAAVRYSAAGQQIGDLMTIFAAPQITGRRGGPISVAIDADGDAVVAYVPVD